MKLPDLKEFTNLWPKSLPVLKESVLTYFKKNNVRYDNVWFPDIDVIIPKDLLDHKNIQVVLFGGFLERVFDTGNWPERDFTFWCLSSKVKKVLIDLFHFPKDSVSCISRYDLFGSPLKVHQLDLNSDINLVYSGRLSAQKNIEMLLAFASILGEKVQVNVQLCLLGQWDNQIPKNRGRFIIPSYQDHVESFQQDLHFKKAPIYIHHLTHNEWLSHLENNSILVNFSTFVCEDFGVSVSMVQNTGMPMLLSKWGGHCDVVGSNVQFAEVENIGQSLLPKEQILLKAQMMVENFLASKLEVAKEKIDEKNITDQTYLDIHELQKIRTKALNHYGHELMLLAQDRMSLFASSPNGKKFFKDFSDIFSGRA